MKPFEHFPQDDKCPLCGTNEDKECYLIQIEGTGDGRIAQAIPTHFECLVERIMWYPKMEVMCGIGFEEDEAR